MSVLVTCPICGSVWPTQPCKRDQQHAQCAGCRSIFEVSLRLVLKGDDVRVVQPSRWVPVNR